MIERQIYQKVQEALARQAAVAIIGPRQIGKTTLAQKVAQQTDSIYLDLEAKEDRDRLSDPVQFLTRNENRLVVLDEIYRVPELFQTLRGVIDKGRREGNRVGRFLILGSASIDLLRQSGESLAGRISYIDMYPFNIQEVIETEDALNRLWIRGGFPDSFLSKNNQDSLLVRKDFIRTYLERDIPQFGARIPAETLERFWTMLAYNQGSLLNASKLASSLMVSAKTITNYIDLLTDLLLVRRLRPFHANIGKRLVKSPKIYVRDSGIAHALLDIEDYNKLAGHPILGMSWEGFVIENIINAAPARTFSSFYRTSAGAEIDLVLEFSGGKVWAIEIKSSLTGKPSKGFYHAIEDIKPDKCFVVCAGETRYPISKEIEAISLLEIIEEIAGL